MPRRSCRAREDQINWHNQLNILLHCCIKIIASYIKMDHITLFPVNNNSTIHKIYFKSFYPGSKFKYSKLCWSQIDHFWHMNIYIKHTHPLHCQRLIVFHETFKRKYIGDISFWTFTRKSFAENSGFFWGNI